MVLESIYEMDLWEYFTKKKAGFWRAKKGFRVDRLYYNC